MKKLIPALILLLVSAMVLSTSSYAWFSMNRTVSATGMSLTSTAPANLLITNADSTQSDPTSWKSSIGASELYTGKLYPASTINAKDTLGFYAISDNQRIGSNNIGGTAETGVTTFKTTALSALQEDNADATGYWAEYTFYMKTTGGSNLTVYLDSINIGTSVSYKNVTSSLTADTSSVVGLYELNGTTYELTTDTTCVADTIYYQKADTYFSSVTTTSFTEGSTPVEDYYTLASGVYTKCEAGATYVSGTVYYEPTGITKCVRIAIFSNDGSDAINEDTDLVAIYAIDESDSYTVYPIKAVDENGVFTARTEAEGDVTTPQGTNAETFDVLAGPTAVTQVLVKVWIEGQHPDCVNAVAGQSFNIGLTFKTVEINQ